MKHSLSRAYVLSAVSYVSITAATAEPIQNPTAIFAGLDKTTGRIVNFDVSIGESVQFGTLQIVPRVCNSRPQTETPQTTSFVEVDELIAKGSSGKHVDDKLERAPIDTKEVKRIFSGWMFASSPGLHGIEHPVYDVWLVDCKGGKESVSPATTPAAPESTPLATPVEDSGKKKKTRKVEPEAPAPVESQPIGPADQVVAPPATPNTTGNEAQPSDAAPVKKKKKQRQKDQNQAGPAAPAAQPSGGGLFPF